MIIVLMGRQKINYELTSLIFPVFDEKNVADDLERIEKDFSQKNQNLEFIAVFDESQSANVANIKISKLPQVKILFYPLKRFGKGFALCYGFNQSKGDRIFFWEGNFSISSEQMFVFLNLMSLLGADIVVGSKRHPLSYVYYSPLRKLVSKIYQIFVLALFGLNIADTQFGFKLYRRDVLEKIIPKLIIKNWAFDLELLVLAHNLGYKRIVEAPIELKKHFTSKQLTTSIALNVLKDTLAIFYRKHIIKYYEQEFV